MDGENNLVPIYIEPGPAFSQNPPNSWWGLAYPEHARVWFDAERSALVDSGATQFWPPPDTLYVEGVAPSTAAGDVTIHLVQQVYGAGPFTDEVVATAADVDLDIDSDNDDGFAGPERTNEEEEIEAKNGMKVLVVNRGDDDDDDIPDYADGFGAFEDDSLAAAGAFAPLVVEVDGLYALPGATVSFEYDAADPSQTTRSWVDIPDIQSGFYEYDRGPGLLRIWRKDAGAGRTHDDFVPSGTPLDIAEFAGAQTFFVEAVNGSATGVPITVTLTTAGGETTSDTVRVLPFDSLNGLGEPEIEGFTIHIGSTEGTPENDIVIGTSDDDVISTGDGDDIIVAGAGDDVIDAGAGDDVVYSWEGNNTIIHGGGGTAAATRQEGRIRLLSERREEVDAGATLHAYWRFYTRDDPWLVVFNQLGGEIRFVPDSSAEASWEWVEDAQGGHPVVNIRANVVEPFRKADLLRREFIKAAGVRGEFQDAMSEELIERIISMEFAGPDDPSITDYTTLQDAALDRATDASAAVARSYLESIRIFSTATDVVVSVGELADGETTVLVAGLSILPFVTAHMVDVGKKFVVRAEGGENLFTLGGALPANMDPRALRAKDSGQFDVGLIPQDTFRDATIFEGRTLLNGTKTSVLVGTPQVTSGHHAFIVEFLGRHRFADDAAEYTVLNRRLNTTTGRLDIANGQGLKLPDVAVVRRDGAVDLYEVQSGTQKLNDLETKLRQMRNGLPPPDLNKGNIFLYDKFGEAVPLAGEPLGPNVPLP